ncbi:FAD-binding oxidoreductase [Acetobacter sacchari]|uniref:FAD-binding oxidoreductase n=1 Tax=Acetobacter sacchari TaxID=2661687 RepID=A0ABS3LUP3_9PROT|nr:FAD-binding oxidoreductase [Acetobacter sacchari]MBO1359634.1 FAD-binding oxidoreductase [Acetobacter sacchari]
MQTDLRSHGLWERTAPPAPYAEALYSTIDTDVVIIGAGYTGLSAALHLAQAGYAPVVVEAAQIGFGGSGRNVGLVNAGMWVKPEDFPGVLGPIYGQRLLTMLGQAPDLVFDLISTHAIACEATRVGTLHCAPDERGLSDLAERTRQWARWGAPVSLLNAQETARLIGSCDYKGALLDRRAGTVQPLAYARGLADAAIGAGARIFVNSPVTGMMQSGDRHIIDTPRGQVRAAKVIVATNAYSTGPFAAISDSLAPLPYFNVATAPLSPSIRARILPEGHGAWDTRSVLSSFRMDAAGRLVFGSVGGLGRWDAAVHRDWARREVTRLYPHLAGVDFETEWSGSIGVTATRLPRLHRLAPGVVAMAGYNGRGIAPGTTFGRVLADMTAGHTPDSELPLPVMNLPEPDVLRGLRGLAYAAGSGLRHFAGARRAR